MSRASKTKTENVRSSLLSDRESEVLEKLLGRRCPSMATAVAQLLVALPHQPSTWSLQHTGVVCLIKDNPQRSYFFRMYDVKAGRQLWEQELYNQIVYSASPQFSFHTFAADDCQVGLNFAQREEAEAFRDAVVGKINQRSNRSERRTLPPVPQEKTSGSRASFRKRSADVPGPDVSPRHRLMPSTSSLRVGKGKNEKKNKKKGLSKADIGAPSGFKHVSHVGFDPNNLDPDLWNLLSQAGIGEDEMRDEQTSQMVYNIIERSGGMEAVKREVKRGAAGPPPPPPSRQGPLPPTPGPANPFPTPPPTRGRSGPLPPIPAHSQRGARGAVPPPPPPSDRGGLPSHVPPAPPPSSSKSCHVSSSGSSRNALPPPPPPQHQRAAGFPAATAPCPPVRGFCGDPAPPPPPPLQISSDPPAPTPASFSSPPPPRGSSPTRVDGRGALLDQIRRGKKLRNVSECQDQTAGPPAESGEGIVGALMMVMQKRSKVIHSSDESEDDGGDDEDDDDEWDD
ncbi:WASP actin nucleation promoting factor b [Syngnathoides biaculeatus]|uniref:WASP actin nucleation promoting factor b n=1 Tax=Syngnathoides biaculeatus TaxID=300417 RepID=UPI002ADDE704|nr:WASP actin nucleation promoting factor b [Syngnathoides biaculeatus]